MSKVTSKNDHNQRPSIPGKYVGPFSLNIKLIKNHNHDYCKYLLESRNVK